MSGRIIKPSWGDKGQTFQFTLQDERVSLDKYLPPEVITKKLFPNAPDKSIGFPMTVGYNVVRVACPLIKTVTSGSFTVRTYLIFGHWAWRPMPGGWVPTAPADLGGDGGGDGFTVIFLDYSDDEAGVGWLLDRTELNRWTFKNGNTRDFGSKIDMPIFYVEHIEASHPLPPDTRITIQCVGMPGFYNDHDKIDNSKIHWYPETATELLYTLYDRYTGYDYTKINDESFRLAGQKGLDKWHVHSFFNGFGSDRMTTIDTIHKRILPQLPVFEYYDQGELGIAFVDIWGPPDSPMQMPVDIPDPKMYLNWKYNVLDVEGKVEEADLTEVYNHFVIKYHLDIDSAAGGWKKTLIITHGQEESGPPDLNTQWLESDRCRKSYYAYGKEDGTGVHRPSPPIHCHDFWHRAAKLDAFDSIGDGRKFRTPAHFLGEFLEYFFTFRAKYMNVICNNSVLFVQPGEFVRFTHADLGFTRKTCLVISKEVGLNRCKLRLRTWENMLTPLDLGL